MNARENFCDYRDKDEVGRMHEAHRRSIHPDMCVYKEWGSLLINEDFKVINKNRSVTDWLDSFFSKTGFTNVAQDTVVRAFGLGMGA